VNSEKTLRATVPGKLIPQKIDRLFTFANF
jgi:hypothetical protein